MCWPRPKLTGESCFCPMDLPASFYDAQQYGAEALRGKCSMKLVPIASEILCTISIGWEIRQGTVWTN